MFRCIKLKYPVLPLLNANIQHFHISSEIYLRGVLPRSTSRNVEDDSFKNDFCPPAMNQNSDGDFFGIESEVGVITLGPPQDSLSKPIKEKHLKEKFRSASFGVVRYDSENKLKFHGQYKNETDFSFPYTSKEDVEVSKNLQKVPNKAKNYSQTVCNIKEISRNDVSHSQKGEPDESYIDKNYFNNISERVNTNFKKDTIHPSSDELNFFDKNYFGNLATSEESNSSEEIDEIFVGKKHSIEDSHVAKSTSEELHFIDENYFKNPVVSEIQNSSNELEFPNNMHPNPDTALNCSEKQIEKNNVESFHANLKPDIDYNQKPHDLFKNATSIVESHDIVHEYTDYNEHNATLPFATKNKRENFNKGINEHNEISNKNHDQKFIHKPKNVFEKSSSPGIIKADFVSNKKEKLLDNDILDIQSQKSHARENGLSHSGQTTEESDVSTAYEFVTKLRKEKETIPQQIIKKEKDSTEEEFDSKGFRILKHQVVDLSYLTKDEIFNILKQNIVYSDDDLLVLNKPYGLVVHESKTTKDPCLSPFLNNLAKEMDPKATDPKLFTVHRLDKETTGCLLLARNETMAQYLKSLLAQRQIIKKYWIVTTRVPDSPEGMIDIPISEGKINNKQRMVLHPKLPKDIAYRNHSISGKEAITSYKVLKEAGNAALIEVFPKTGIKHQIRVHFGFGLSCPILGDHKYSHFDKLAPQKLPSDILQRLQVRQSKVRYIPMHIHAMSVTIPKYFEERELCVTIPLPNHMKINIKRLKLNRRKV